MHRMPVKTTAIQRLRRSRMFGWDGNPVRRRIDRLEGCMFAVLVAIFLIAAPVGAALAEHWTNGAGAKLQQEERSWRQVSAFVERTPPGWQDNSPGPSGTVWMRAHWTAPDGRARKGWIPVDPKTTVGSSPRIWVDNSGFVTQPPMLTDQLRGWIQIAEVIAPCLLALILILVGREGRFLFARRQMGEWDKP